MRDIWPGFKTRFKSRKDEVLGGDIVVFDAQALKVIWRISPAIYSIKTNRSNKSKI